jgi:16S rRNA (cytosine967-C5)-methyltransferase
LKTEPGPLLARWRQEENVDYDFVARDWIPENSIFRLKSHPPLKSLPSFQDGLFYVQDPSTLLAVAQVAPQTSEILLDLCAAPGGKLSALSERMGNTGLLFAAEIAPPRLALIDENVRRLGLKNVETLALEDLLPQARRFDAILVDAPCSNTGVMRRRVELRWRVSPEEIQRMSATQLELLNQAVRMLKPRGRLVYSTCSLEPEENVEVVQKFLAAHPGFRLETERELLPFQDGVDGAYSARLMAG